MNIGPTQKPVVDLPVINVNRATASGNATSPQAGGVEQEVAVVQAASPVDRERVERAAVALQEFVQSVRRDINFRVDDGSGQLVIKVTDQESGDLIRQIPSEEALQIAENLDAVRSKLFSVEV